MAASFTPEIMKAHRGTWYVYAGTEKIRYQATMRGQWGYDVECSCGRFSTNTGGAVRRYVEDELWDHRFSMQTEADKAAGLI
jgi:hypothetical protein